MTPLAALASVEPGRARARILSALARSGSVDAAARELGVSRRTLYRLIAQLDLGALVAERSRPAE